MNIVFEASAGTGKTYQVTHLYVSLVLGLPFESSDSEGRPLQLNETADLARPADARRILLMTFTDNAAAELRERITSLVLARQREAESKGLDALAENTRKCLAALPGAPISTIHSFCAAFLRRHALEAGLSPAFAVLDQDDSSALLEDMARGEILRQLDRHGASYSADFARFCAGVPVLGDIRGSVLQTVLRLIRQASSHGICVEDSSSLLPPLDCAVTRDDFAEILALLETIHQRKPLPRRASHVRQALLQALAEGAKDNQPSLSAKPESIAEQIADALEAENANAFTGAGLNEISQKFVALKTAAAGHAGYRRHYTEITAFTRFLAKVARSYAQAKRDRDCLDFDDLLAMTRNLLMSDECRRTARATFDHIIVDEVQDTSRIQSDIIRSLWNPPTNRLVICGDIKQSIYGWRDADPRVMSELQEAIEKTGVSHSIPLRTSFRSADCILDFVNPLFISIYGTAYGGPLIPRDRSRLRQRGEMPCVEFLSDPWEDPQRAEDAPDRDTRLRAEMSAIAQRIRLLVDGDPAWRPRFRYNPSPREFEPSEGANRYRYSDVLILLRQTTHLQALEHALHQHNIPYMLGGRGKGFFTRPEVGDVYLFLKVLAEPSDLIALVGFLRSPWIGLSDETLMRIGWDKDHFDPQRLAASVKQKGGALPDLPDPAESARLRDAVSILGEFRPMSHRRLASELVRALIARTGYDAVLAGTFRGNQRVANLRKAIDWLRKTERGGANLLHDVAAELGHAIHNPPDMPEAALLDPDQNVVRVMTIHGAKGLSAQVVFLPDIGSLPPPDSGWAFFSDTANAAPKIHIRLTLPDDRRIATPGFEAARESSKSARQEESKNLLYVAMTRAHDLVVVSGASVRKKRDGWQSWINAATGQEPSESALFRKIPFTDLEAACSPPARFRPPSLPAPELFGAAEDAGRPLTGGLACMRYSATKLAQRAATSGLIPGPDVEPTEDASSVHPASLYREADGGTAADLGTIGHVALAQIALDSGRTDLAKMLKRLMEPETLSAGSRSELLAKLARTREWLLPRLSAAVPGTVHVEWPFAIAYEQAGRTLIVDGTIDLFYRGADGQWQIWDYKFTDSQEDLASRYGLQLGLYAEALIRSMKIEPTTIAGGIVAIRSGDILEVPVPIDLAPLKGRAFCAAVALSSQL